MQEEPRRYRTESLDGRLRCNARQRVIVSLIQRLAAFAGLREPGGVFGGRQGVHDEAHVGKSIAAEMRGEAGVMARRAREKIEARAHSRHRVDLRAELRHEES